MEIEQSLLDRIDRAAAKYAGAMHWIEIHTQKTGAQAAIDVLTQEEKEDWQQAVCDMINFGRQRSDEEKADIFFTILRESIKEYTELVGEIGKPKMRPRPPETLERKPPIGLIPRYLREEERFREVNAAIQNYQAVGKTIPNEWIEERNELEAAYNSRRMNQPV